MDYRNRIEAILNNISTVIIGKSYAAELMLTTLLCRGHLLIEDVPGVGKTSLISALAKSVNCSFKRIQFTPDILPSDITGFSMYNQKTGEFEYRPGLIMSSFILADEINRTSPKTQASLLEVMEESQVTVDGKTYKLDQPFMVLATQNPTEYLGTYPLPEAQVDRFLMKISIGYPTASDEVKILHRYRGADPLAELSPVADASDILELQNKAREVHIEQSLYDYIVAITGYTRKHRNVELGVSPRGTLALMRASQAWALMKGRTFVLPDDIKNMAQPVLGHRIILTQEAKLSNMQSYNIIAEALSSIPIPMT